jgi:hypothetical protein
MGNQGKHIPRHNNYIPGRGPLTHKDPQALLDKFAGKGEPVEASHEDNRGSRNVWTSARSLERSVVIRQQKDSSTTPGMVPTLSRRTHERHGPYAMRSFALAPTGGGSSSTPDTKEAAKEPGSGTHRAGPEKAWTEGAESNSKWTQTSGDGTKAVQNTVYDG